MRSVIIGKGNLGLDLGLELKAAGHDVIYYTKSDGFKCPESLTSLILKEPTHVWVTAGAGSVEACENDPGEALRTHVELPYLLAKRLPKSVKLICFSTDYAADEASPTSPIRQTAHPKSFYAQTKLWMEQALTLTQRPELAIVRVGSLYGHHFPLRTFPGKLKHRYTEPCEIYLPQNWVVPTPTWWLAKMLVGNINQLCRAMPTIHHLAPGGGCTVIQWGKMILGEKYIVHSKGFDQTRPAFSNLGNSLNKSGLQWVKLWEQHLEQARSAEHQKASDHAG